jgi:hypothetical protein
MTTDPPPEPYEAASARLALLRQMEALTRNLTRLGAQPLVEQEAAEALALDDLRAAVLVTGRYLVDLADALEGTSGHVTRARRRPGDPG